MKFIVASVTALVIIMAHASILRADNLYRNNNDNVTHKQGVAADPTNIIEMNRRLFSSFPLVSDRLGICSHSLNSTLAAKLADYKFKYIRTDLRWSTVETSLGVYDFSKFDSMLSSMEEYGLTPYIILNNTNQLYTSNAALTTDTDIQGFANFVTVAVNRYKGKGVIWEIWNEPGGKWTPEQYVNLVKVIAPIIRDIDPSGTIVGPALSNMKIRTVKWFEATCSLGILDYFDKLSFHPYTSSMPPEALTADYDNMKAIIAKYTDRDIPILAGEIGYSTVPDWDGKGNICVVTEEIRAKYLVRLLMINLINKIDITNIYVSVTPRTSNNNAENWFGIFSPTTYEATSSADAIKNIMTALEGYAYISKVYTLSNDDYILKFMNQNGNFYCVAWTTASEHNVMIDGKINVLLTDTPQIVNIKN